jgi:dTDP-glucose 4,6-dehydratase
LDRLTYAGNQNRLAQMACWDKEKSRVKFIYHDLRSPIQEELKFQASHPYPDYILHLAAESHVDRSIADAIPFVEANVTGTVNLLNFARGVKPERFIYCSTDEVFGSVVNGQLHVEGSPFKPSNPYSASKASAESFCYAFQNTYGVPIIVTNTMNLYGERQSPEKFVPKTIKNIYIDNPVVLHCKKDEAGNIIDISSRCWLHCRNYAAAVLFLLEKGTVGEHYNVTGELRTVEEIADYIGQVLGKTPVKYFEDFHSFRPGHDLAYGLDGTKMKNMGWVQPVTLEDALAKTIRWTVAHPEWIGCL